jgi:hypothetical protein
MNPSYKSVHERPIAKLIGWIAIAITFGIPLYAVIELIRWIFF